MAARPEGRTKHEMVETAMLTEVEQTYFRPEEAAEYLRVGRTTMYALLSSGAIPSATAGRIRILRKADLDAFIDRKVEAAKRGES